MGSYQYKTKKLTPSSGKMHPSLIITLRKNSEQSNHPQAHLTETITCLSAYFLCLRADLDTEPYPTLILDRNSGFILSLNLAAFEYLAIDAVGLQLHDFIVDQTAYNRIEAQLQQTKASHQRIVLRNADGVCMGCTIKVEIDSYYSGWAIARLCAINDCRIT